MAKKVIPYTELKSTLCEDGKPHEIWLGFTGDTEPAFCIKCDTVSRDVPDEVFEDF